MGGPYSLGKQVLGAQLGGALKADSVAASTLPGPYQQLCAWNSPDGEPVPIVVGTELTRYVNEEIAATIAMVSPVNTAFGSATWTANARQGDCLLEYGIGPNLRRRIIDLQSGNFQLPPVSQLRVSARFYNRSASAFSNAQYFSAALMPGFVPDPSVATYSGQVAYAGVDAEYSFFPPLGCKGWRLFSTAYHGADVQILYGGAQPPGYIDYATDVYVPPVADLAYVQDEIAMDVTGAGSCAIVVQALVGF